MTPLLQEAVRLTPEPESAIWFDVGFVTNVINPTRVPIETVMHLPFTRTGIAGIDKDGRKFCFLMVNGENSVTIQACVIGPPARFSEPFAYLMTEQGLRYYNKNKEVSQAEIMPVFRMVCAVLMKLADASQGYRPTPQKTFINRKRQAKGKSALMFDWHTVEIGKASIKTASLGGHHASPRYHDRRGHWRKHPSGKLVWVKPCKVGDPSKGIVFKDYKIAKTENRL